MKQLYKVPFERNSDRVKEIRHQYVQRVLELEARETLHTFIYVDEAGFNLAKGRRHGRNRIGQRATTEVPGQRGGNITMCAAISDNGVLTHIPLLGPYNTQHLLTFLDTLYRDLVPENERGGGQLSKVKPGLCVVGGSGCSAEWTFAEVCKMALLDPQEKQYFRKNMEFNIARQTLTTKLCPGCRSAVMRANESDLNVLCKVCTAVAGRPFEFCWQCLREWKGPRPRKDRCENDDCCNESLETLKKCPDITLHRYVYDDEYEFGIRVCPSVRACPTCGLLLQHSKKGCPLVFCPRCNGTFCFVCLKRSSTCWRIRCTPAPRQTSIPVWKKK
ncbi:uncharacterized protein LOC120740972 [Simochromis diagramma]|uniref:uncharacterized protein LOC120740972 n=1 Tax=Simochromis diagramma TaxID=43689 RepID=UPI001A7E516D|nr:uncharacterized protein LOC120740972 [Simochromis diagramma]